MMAIVAEGERGRVYLPPIREHESVVSEANPQWKPEAPLPHNPRDFKTPLYGLTTFADLFTDRQLVALTTFSDLVGEARERIRLDAVAVAAGLPDDGVPLREGGTGATAYAEAVGVYLAFAIVEMQTDVLIFAGGETPSAKPTEFLPDKRLPWYGTTPRRMCFPPQHRTGWHRLLGL